MDRRIAPPPYPTERLGGKDPTFEIGSHLLDEKRVEIARYENDHSLPYQADTVVDVTCPDSRVLLSLAIGFVPDDPSLTSLALTKCTVRLTATKDFGFGAQDVENLLGASGAPVEIAGNGLWGFNYSPTEEVEAMRARLHIESPDAQPKTGRWFACARWQALRPMSEIDWRAAISKCVLLVSPQKIRLTDERPG